MNKFKNHKNKPFWQLLIAFLLGISITVGALQMTDLGQGRLQLRNLTEDKDQPPTPTTRELELNDNIVDLTKPIREVEKICEITNCDLLEEILGLKTLFQNYTLANNTFSNSFTNFTNNWTAFTGSWTSFTSNWTAFTGSWTNFTNSWTNFTGQWTNFTGQWTQFTSQWTSFTGQWTQFTSQWTSFTSSWTNFTDQVKNDLDEIKSLLKQLIKKL